MFWKSLKISQENASVGVFLHKVVGPQISKLIKKRLQHRFFPVKFAKILRTPCFTDCLQQLLLLVEGFQPATLLKMRLQQRCFLCEFYKILSTSFDRPPPGDCSLCLSENFEKFFRTPLLQSTLFHVHIVKRNNLLWLLFLVLWLIYKLQNFNHQIQ